MLRAHQKEALGACIAAPQGGLIVSPTGSGKSHIIAALCQQLNDRDVLVVTPRVELTRQNVAKITSSAVSMTVNTAYRQKVKTDVLIIDECHLVRQYDGMYQALMRNANLTYGFTATPFRLDCGPLHPAIFEHKLYEIERETLVRAGFLAKRKIIEIPSNLIINVRNSSFNSLGQLSKDSCPKTKGCIEHFLADADPTKQALIFVCDLKHGRIAQQHFPRSEIVHSQMSKKVRQNLVERFKINDLQYLINCEILTTGFDHPPLEQLVILRPTNSYTLYEQICGRGDRVSLGKQYNMIYDYTVNNFNFDYVKCGRTSPHRYCMFCLKITDYRLKTCTECNRTLVKGEAPTKRCSGCGHKNFNCATYCANCGVFVKDNVLHVTTGTLRWDGRGTLMIGDVKFKTTSVGASTLIGQLSSGMYDFYYKWNSRHKTNQLIEIRKATS